jgi:hypothetical protein
VSIALHNQESFVQTGWQSPKHRLAWPFAISLILHLIVFSQINWNGLLARIKVQHRMTVSFAPESLPEEHRPQVRTWQPHETSPSANTQGAIDALDARESGYSLDLGEIRNQAREYAKKEFALSDGGLPLYGDYFGTYSGDDSGVFSFRLDPDGQVTGSGESSASGIVFEVVGMITPSGVVHVVAKRGEVKVNLSGQLNVKTGKISGSWYFSGTRFFSGSAEGLFSGQHE